MTGPYVWIEFCNGMVPQGTIGAVVNLSYQHHNGDHHGPVSGSCAVLDML